MSRATYSCLLGLLLLAVPVSAQTGSISGKVTDAATSQGIGRAEVSVLLPGRETTPLRQTATDSAGSFRLENLEPGVYRLAVFHQSYAHRDLRIPGKTETVTVTAGDTATHDFALTRPGVIAGRVVDEDGAPMVQAQIWTLRNTYMNGRKEMLPMDRPVATDDQGNFRIFGIEPGRYYLAARPSARRPNALEAGASEGYPLTYFPGTTDPAAAAQVEVTAGSEMQGAQIILRKSRTVVVRGRVINESGVKQQHLVTLNPVVNVGPRRDYRTPVSDDGSFEIAGVHPGLYVATSAISTPQGTAMGQAGVAVASQDVESVVIRVARHFEVNGRVRSEGGGDADVTTGIVSIRAADSFSIGGDGGRIAEDGSFKLVRMFPGRYTVEVLGPKSHYLKSVRLGGQDVTDDAIDLVDGSGPIEVVMGSNPGAIQGYVRKGGSAVSGARVVLAPASEKRRRNRTEYRVLRTDEQGAYQASGLRPGDYRVYAWMEVEEGAWFDADFMLPFENSAAKVAVAEGAQEQIDVELFAPR